MVEGRSGFGLANWSEEGLVAIGGRKYGIFPGQSGSYLLKTPLKFGTRTKTAGVFEMSGKWKLHVLDLRLSQKEVTRRSTVPSIATYKSYKIGRGKKRQLYEI